MSAAAAPSPTTSPPEPSRLWLPCLLAAALLCYGLGIESPGRFKGDELYYMRSGAEMVWTGDWRVPVYEGQVRFQKPPAAYWLVAASYRLLGVDLWSARLPSVLLAAAGIGLAHRLGRLLYGSRRAGLYAAAALLSSYGFYRHGRWALTDTLLSVAMLAAFLGFAEATFRGRRGGAIAGWGALAVATLTKGPIALGVGGGGLLLFAALAPADLRRRLRCVLDPAGLLLYAALVGGWLALLLHTVGLDAASAGSGHELAKHFRPNPLRVFSGFAYYLDAALRGLFPWAFLLLFFLRREERDAAFRYLGAWSLAVVAPFALFVRMLRLRYLVVGIPALAILCGGALARIEECAGLRSRLVRFVLAAFVAGYAFALGLALLTLVPLAWHLASPVLGAAAVALALAAAGLLAGAAALRGNARFETVVLGSALGTTLLFGIYYGSWYPHARTVPAYELGRRLRPELAPDASLGTVGLDAEDRSFLSVGAAVAVRNPSPRRDPGRTVAGLEAAPPDVLVTTAPALATLPARLRAIYTEEFRTPGAGLHLAPEAGLRLLWGRPARLRTDDPDLVVLRRRPAP